MGKEGHPKKHFVTLISVFLINNKKGMHIKIRNWFNKFTVCFHFKTIFKSIFHKPYVCFFLESEVFEIWI